MMSALPRTGASRLAAIALVGAMILGGAACSDDASDDTGAASTETTAPATNDGNVIEVTASDFTFDGIPATVPAGSRFSLTTA